MAALQRNCNAFRKAGEPATQFEDGNAWSKRRRELAHGASADRVGPINKGRQQRCAALGVLLSPIIVRVAI